MKKVLSFVAAILCIALLAMPISAAEYDAYGLYQEAMKRMENVETLDMNLFLNMTLEIAGESMDVEARGTIKMVMKENGEPDMEMVLRMEDEVYTMYYRNGWTYENYGDTKVRYKNLDFSSLVDDSFVTSANDMEKNWLENATTESVDRGTYIRFNIPAAEMNELMSQVAGIVGEGLDITNMRMGSVNSRMLIGNDHKLKEYKLTTSLASTVEDVPVRIVMSCTMAIHSVNYIEKIDFPSDLASYELIVLELPVAAVEEQQPAPVYVEADAPAEATAETTADAADTEAADTTEDADTADEDADEDAA